MIRSVLSSSRSLLRRNPVVLPVRTLLQPSGFRQFHFTRAVRSEEKKAETPPETPAEDAAEKKETPTEEAKVEKTDLEKCQEQLAAKEKELAEMKKNYLTSLAEMQNLRQRTANDVTAAKKYGGQSVCKSMLDVADNIGIALKHTREEVSDENPQLKNFFEGIEMTQTIMMKSLEDNGVTKMEVEGLKFDPNFHEGLYDYEDPTKEPGTVGQVVKEGYMLKDRCLRAAQVGTIKAPKA